MATSILSETDNGTYIDRTGDIVLVFTDHDGKKKSLTLQEEAGRGFGRCACADDGYYEGDYAPYLPVRLFLPNIKRPDTPAYDIEEIERNEEHDGAWIGDQGTLIIHRSENNPYRILHVMFSYDTYNEIKFVLYNFSPIILNHSHKEEKFRPIMADEYLTAVPVASKETDVSDHTRETFRDKLDNIQKQIDRMSEKISIAFSFAQNAQNIADSIVTRVSKIEQESKLSSNAREIPDSEGFWRDDDGDVWVRDIAGTTLLIAKGHKQSTQEIYDLSHNCSSDFVMHQCGPYIKINNPFILGEDHAD